MRLIRFLSSILGLRRLRRRRLQKLRFRLECLRLQLALERQARDLEAEQLAGYRDAFAAIQVNYNALGAAAKAETAAITRKTG